MSHRGKGWGQGRGWGHQGKGWGHQGGRVKEGGCGGRGTHTGLH